MKNLKLSRPGYKNGMFGKVGSLNPMFSKKHSEESIKKIKEARARQFINPMLGKHHSEETKRKIRLAITSKNRIGYKHSQETRRKISDSNMGHFVSDSVRQKLSKFHTGLKHSDKSKEKMKIARIKYIKRIGNKFPIHGKRTYYNGVSFRSSWEAKFAQRLDDLKIIWQYELMLEIPSGIYFPDFYLNEINSYIEIKGFWRDLARIKFDEASKIYPLILLEQKELKTLGIFDSDNIFNKENFIKKLLECTK